MKKIGVIVGSIRKNSFSLSVANEFINQASNNFEYKIVEIGNLPLYNQDFDEPELNPAVYDSFRKEIQSYDGFVFVTPEHNRSYPASLKNALDIASRPWGQNVWDNKPAILISNSPGRLSAFGANHHLRQVLSFLNIHVLDQPELYIGEVMNVIGTDGKINDESVKGLLKSGAEAFEAWVNKF